jgi:hypothetical protein
MMMQSIPRGRKSIYDEYCSLYRSAVPTIAPARAKKKGQRSKEPLSKDISLHAMLAKSVARNQFKKPAGRKKTARNALPPWVK